MNIFILHHNHIICAKYHCDKHIVKMIIETAQLLYTCILISGIIGHDNSIINTAPLNSSGNHGYRPTHKNHPCSIWLRESIANYEWLCNLGIELCKQYYYVMEKYMQLNYTLNGYAVYVPTYLIEI